MARRTCPLCSSELAAKDHDRLWHAYFKEGAAAALELAGEILGVEPSERELRRHMDKHRPRQAPAPRDAARKDQKIRLSERKLAIIDFASRFRGFTAELIAASLYWPNDGTERQLQAAERNALLSLRYLFARDLLYRIYPESLDGPRLRRLPPPSFFLGARALAVLDGEHDVVRGSASTLPSRDDVMRWQRDSEILTQLFTKLPLSSAYGRRHAFGHDGAVVELDLRNIYDRRWAQIRFSDPLKLSSRVRAGALCAFRVRAPEGHQALVPAFLYRDRGISAPEKVADELRAQLGLLRSGELVRRFPQLPASSTPVTLIIAETPDRAKQLVEATQSAAQARIPAFCGLLGALSSASIGEYRWLRLFDSRRGAATLFELLAEQATAFPDAERLIAADKRPRQSGPRA